MSKPENPALFETVGSSGDYAYGTSIDLRDILAGMAMQAIIPLTWDDDTYEACAERAYLQADAMLRAREATK